MTPDPKLMEKIRAILRKAEESSNPSEEEREVAMRLANKLLLKHGLEIADLGNLDPTDESFTHHPWFGIDDAMNAWRLDLAHRMSSTYFVKVYRIPGAKKGTGKIAVLGREENVSALKAMFKFVAPQLQREFDAAAGKMGLYWRIARRYCEAAALERGMDIDEMSLEEIAEVGAERLQEKTEAGGRALAISDVKFLAALNSEGYATNALPRIRAGELAPYNTDKNLKVWRNSFFVGAVQKVGMRLDELMREEVEELGEPGTDLVFNQEADLRRYQDSLDLGLRSQSRSRKIDGEGYSAGSAAGARADLSGHKKMTGRRAQLNA